MKPCKLIVLFIIGFFISACEKNNDNSEEPGIGNFVFEDGFETQNNTIDELFLSNGGRWTGIQQVNPANSTNEISISQTIFSEGESSLHLFASQSDNILSKMDIEKEGFNASENDKIIIKADFYINSNANIENLLLIDLECCSCWDNTADIANQCPGIRLQMSGGNDFLSIERGKIAENTIQQTSFQFPRNEWVTVQWELNLADNDSGVNKLLINGTEIINTAGTNMPNAQKFRDLFAQEGIDFNFQEPVSYERIQIGVTANPTPENIELFVDNFSLRIEKKIP
ncbi:heparin lyase I family protein [Spongiimicrobium salis]|uniref:heparin lyase I family protein n=1 Tax=Spongiimicrobium salis TaxID=1667022 RepID=UPI00374CD877